MALLHYKLAHLGSNWVLCCEDIPVDAFASHAKAMDCARQMVARADQRGDMAVLQLDGHKPHPSNA
jgi:hypothetical protein